MSLRPNLDLLWYKDPLNWCSISAVSFVFWKDGWRTFYRKDLKLAADAVGHLPLQTLSSVEPIFKLCQDSTIHLLCSLLLLLDARTERTDKKQFFDPLVLKKIETGFEPSNPNHGNPVEWPSLRLARKALIFTGSYLKWWHLFLGQKDALEIFMSLSIVKNGLVSGKNIQLFARPCNKWPLKRNFVQTYFQFPCRFLTKQTDK